MYFNKIPKMDFEFFRFSWTTFTEKNKHRRAGMLLGSNIIFWKEKGNSAPPPAALSTTYTAKMAELKTDPIKTSRSFHDSEAETPMPVLYKKSFKRFPQWDFEDVYNQDSPPRKTVRMLFQNRTEIIQI